MERQKIYDVGIIGAGVVGASIFNKLTRIGKKCFMLDKASDVATGASKANSGCIHAGYDPMPGSLMAKLNVRGHKLYPKICKRLNVDLKKVGALVVGKDKEMVKILYDRGIKNGVNVEILNKTQIHKMVPSLKSDISTALYAKDAYIISPYRFNVALTDDGILNGGKVFLEEDIKSIKKEKGYFKIKTQKGTYCAKQIVNSTGAGYNDVAKIIGSEEYPIELKVGEYYVFDKNSDLGVPCTLFPLPTKEGKGVLINPTVDGNYLVGPTSLPSDGLATVSMNGLNDIREKIKLMVDDLNYRNVIREFSGIRAISGKDFIIEKSKKVDGVINLAGICSPGLSAAPAIAEMVVELLGYKNKEKENLKEYKPFVLFKDMPKKEQDRLSKKDKNYCSIACKCENITRGDIIASLNRPLKVHSVDAIKRRTNAGMGRCQGGFCFTKVVTEISKQRKIKLEDVLKENRGSNIVLGNIREVKHD